MYFTETWLQELISGSNSIITGFWIIQANRDCRLRARKGRGGCSTCQPTAIQPTAAVSYHQFRKTLYTNAFLAITKDFTHTSLSAILLIIRQMQHQRKVNFGFTACKCNKIAYISKSPSLYDRSDHNQVLGSLLRILRLVAACDYKKCTEDDESLLQRMREDKVTYRRLPQPPHSIFVSRSLVKLPTSEGHVRKSMSIPEKSCQTLGQHPLDLLQFAFCPRLRAKDEHSQLHSYWGDYGI